MAPSGVDITCVNEFKILRSTKSSINICLISHQNSNIEFFRNFLEFGQHGSKLKHDGKLMQINEFHMQQISGYLLLPFS